MAAINPAHSHEALILRTDIHSTPCHLLPTLLQQAEADLSASIPLLAETGPLAVQLSCLARRALPSVDPSPVVNLNGRAGGVMLAATGRRSITISNAGALAVAYDVKVNCKPCPGCIPVEARASATSCWIALSAAV
jgi:hypothetical protein